MYAGLLVNTFNKIGLPKSVECLLSSLKIEVTAFYFVTNRFQNSYGSVVYPKLSDSLLRQAKFNFL